MKMWWLEGVRGVGEHVGPGGWWVTRNQSAMAHHPPLPPWLVALICFRVFPAKSRKLKLKHYKCFTQMKWKDITHRITHENKWEFHFLQEHCSGSNQCWRHNQMPINSGWSDWPHNVCGCIKIKKGHSTELHWALLKQNGKYIIGDERVSVFFTQIQFSSVGQSCPTLCDPMNRSTPGLPVHSSP